MTDIVKRLRDIAGTRSQYSSIWDKLALDAADYIDNSRNKEQNITLCELNSRIQVLETALREIISTSTKNKGVAHQYVTNIARRALEGKC